MGLPIKGVKINDIIIMNFIKCGWCDLLIIPFEAAILTFNKFYKKNLNMNDIFYINNIKTKYDHHELYPINMLPQNPEIMYNIMIPENINNIYTGQPIYISNKLVGIISKVEDDELVLSIPVNYIFIALNKIDNDHIYSINEDIEFLNKIYNCKITNETIYCSLLKKVIPLDCYFAVHGDREKKFSTNIGIITSVPYINQLINVEHNNDILIIGSKILLNACFLHWLKFNKMDEYIDRFFNNNFQDLNVKINGKDYIVALI